MSRGGRGGARGGSNALGVDIDPTFLEEANRFAEEQNRVQADREKKSGAASDQNSFDWPIYPGGIPRAPVPDARERAIYEIGRLRRERIRNGTFWTGEPGEVSDLMLRDARDPANFNAFDDRDTYANRLRGPKFRLPDLSKHKWANPGVSHPGELWALMGYRPETYEEDRKLRKTQVAMVKKNRDPLASIMDDEDGEGEKGEDDEVLEDVVNEEGEEEEPQDDEYDEDEDDLDNDYNAEQYFDGGEDDFDDMGGDDGGDDGY